MDKNSYETGWCDSSQYQVEYRQVMRTSVGAGIPLIALGALFGGVAASAVAATFFVNETVKNWYPVGILVTVGAVLLTLGIVIKKRDDRKFEERLKAFHDKWNHRFEVLGVRK